MWRDHYYQKARVANVDKMSEGQKAVNVYEMRLCCCREHYVDCFTREAPEERREKCKDLTLPVIFVAFLCR